MKRPLYKNPAAPVEARVQDLLARMTLEEKAEQLCQDTIGKDPNPDNHGTDSEFNPRVGSIYQYCGDTRTRNAFQRIATTRAGAATSRATARTPTRPAASPPPPCAASSATAAAPRA